MKIGYVLKQFPKLSETFVLNEILAHEERGHELSVFSLTVPGETRIHGAVGRLRGDIHQLGNGRSREVALALAASREAFEGLPGAAFGGLFDLLGRQDKDSLKSVRQVFELVMLARASKIEHLHAHFAGVASDVAQAAAQILGIPWSFTCHAKDIYHDSVDRVVLAERIEAADAVVTVCDSNLEFLQSEVCGHQVSHLHRLYNGIDTRAFHPRNRCPSSSNLVVAVGRLVEKKGFEYLIDATRELVARGVDLSVKIAGDGRERIALQERIDSSGLGDVVELLGAVDQEQVQRLLRSTQLLVQPCVVGADGNQDALPTVILEAMAAGAPVISTRVGGIEEMLGPGAGVLVPERSAEHLANEIEGSLSNTSRRLKIAQLARARAEREFDLRVNSSRLAQVFAQCARLDEVRAVS